MKQCIKGNHLKYGDPFVQKAPEGVVLCMDCVDKHEDKQIYNIFAGEGRRVGKYQVGYEPGLYATLKADPATMGHTINTMIEQSMAIGKAMSDTTMVLTPPPKAQMLKVQLTQKQRDKICTEIYASEMCDKRLTFGCKIKASINRGYDYDPDIVVEYLNIVSIEGTNGKMYIQTDRYIMDNPDLEVSLFREGVEEGHNEIMGHDVHIGNALDRYEKKFATLDRSYNFTDGLYVMITDRKNKLSPIPRCNATPERDNILAHIKTLLDKAKL